MGKIASDARQSSMELCPRNGKKTFIEPLHDCLDRLTPEQRLAIHLRFWEEMEIAQIAIATESTWNQVNQLLENTILQLREMLAARLRMDTGAVEAA